VLLIILFIIKYSCIIWKDSKVNTKNNFIDDDYDYEAFLRFKAIHYNNNDENNDENICYNYEIKDDDSAFLWLRRYNSKWGDPSFDYHEAVGFSIIPDKYKYEYISHLEHTSYIVLDENEYYKLTRIKLRKRYGIAIRAVYVQLGGHFSLFRSKNNDYLVNYFAMGSRVWQRDKSVLFFEADELPKDLFVHHTVIR
jgi:hypothetical protein